jgi:hypothetical protein
MAAAMAPAMMKDAKVKDLRGWAMRQSNEPGSTHGGHDVKRCRNS